MTVNDDDSMLQMMMTFTTVCVGDKSSKGRRKGGRLYEGVEGHDSGGADGHSLH